MPIFRTRFKKEIICEFLPSVKKSNRVVILCAGMPGYPGRRNELMEFLAKKGYWVFLPRYRGSWESSGGFLKKSPHIDVLDIISQLPKGFVDLWNNKKYKINSPKIYLIGSSFGGPAVLLAAEDKRVKKVVALSPVVDWRIESEAEPLDFLGKFTRLAFGLGYRFNQKDWNKLAGGRFYNPVSRANNIKGEKILIFHAQDDEVVYFEPTQKFAKKIRAKFVALKTGGHLGLARFAEPKFWRIIKKFLA